MMESDQVKALIFGLARLAAFIILLPLWLLVLVVFEIERWALRRRYGRGCDHQQQGGLQDG